MKKISSPLLMVFSISLILGCEDQRNSSSEALDASIGPKSMEIDFQTALADSGFYQEDMTEVDMTEADMTEADMTEADMTEVDMTEADMTEADMTEADMTEADMTEACIESYEICDGVDNDCDGQVDEAHWELDAQSRGMVLYFGSDQELANGFLLITSTNREGESLISSLNAADLEDGYRYTSEDAISVSLRVVGESGPWSIQVSEITDFSVDQRLLPPPYPTMNSQDHAGEEPVIYHLSNNLAEGAFCAGTCPRVLSACIDGAVYCPEPQTHVELCNEIDDDCDGRVDENLTMRCSEPERGGMLGVCGQALSQCIEGQWSSCEFEDLRVSGQPVSRLISDTERCDCYDNNCNGAVDEPDSYDHLTELDTIDWSQNVCSPELGSFTSPQRFEPECHYRPLLQTVPLIRSHVLDLDGDYHLGSLTVHEDTRVRIRRPMDSTGPGYVWESAPDQCFEGVLNHIGGNMNLFAERIELKRGATLSADSTFTLCFYGSTNPFMVALPGGSGGHIGLYASELMINGQITANGSTPSNASIQTSDYLKMAGGAAGSITIVGRDLSLEGGSLIAHGGRGACTLNSRVLCNESLYAGGGPGGMGGAPSFNNPDGGSGSGGGNYDQVNPLRGVRVIGDLSGLPPSSIQVGSGVVDEDFVPTCEGNLLLSGNVSRLETSILCIGDMPRSFTMKQWSLIPLDAEGIPRISDEISIAIYPLSSISEADPEPLMSTRALTIEGALNFNRDQLGEGTSSTFQVRVNQAENVTPRVHSLLLSGISTLREPFSAEFELNESGSLIIDLP